MNNNLYELERNLPRESCSICLHLSLLGPDENFKYDIKCVLLDERPTIDSSCIYFEPEHSKLNHHSVDKAYIDFLESCFKISYEEYLKTIHWKLFEKYALDLANYRCSICGDKDELIVRHIDKKLGRETFDDVCVVCHNCSIRF